jgi:hypothetical protein
MKKMIKRERTNHALHMDTVEAIHSSMTLEEAMQEFLLSKKAERSSERTIKDYNSHFRYFKTWLQETNPERKLTEITSKMISVNDNRVLKNNLTIH